MDISGDHGPLKMEGKIDQITQLIEQIENKEIPDLED